MSGQGVFKLSRNVSTSLLSLNASATPLLMMVGTLMGVISYRL